MSVEIAPFPALTVDTRGVRNRENFRRLADYLLALPPDYAHFDMEAFVLGPGIYRHAPMTQAVRYLLAHESDGRGLEGHYCGTVACALGHAPVAGIGRDYEGDWWDYSGKYFVSCGGDFDDLGKAREFETERSVWSFCFGEEWQEIDNTHVGAARRIDYVLDGRPIPAWRDLETWYGDLPLVSDEDYDERQREIAARLPYDASHLLERASA